jgi:hypothetical protein
MIVVAEIDGFFEAYRVLALLSSFSDDPDASPSSCSPLLLLSGMSLESKASVAVVSATESSLRTPSSEMSPKSVHLYCQMLVKNPVLHKTSFRSWIAAAGPGLSSSAAAAVVVATKEAATKSRRHRERPSSCGGVQGSWRAAGGGAKACATPSKTRLTTPVSLVVGVMMRERAGEEGLLALATNQESGRAFVCLPMVVLLVSPCFVIH